jgi:hypothetical protein
VGVAAAAVRALVVDPTKAAQDQAAQDQVVQDQVVQDQDSPVVEVVAFPADSGAASDPARPVEASAAWQVLKGNAATPAAEIPAA